MTIAKDKIQHFIAGILLTVITDYLCFASGCSLDCTISAGIIMAIMAGAAKELIWDECLGMGEPDIFDFIATMAGGLAISPIIVYILR